MLLNETTAIRIKVLEGNVETWNQEDDNGKSSDESKFNLSVEQVESKDHLQWQTAEQR